MGSRLASFVIWAAVAACAVFWGLRLSGQPMRAPAQASVAAQDLPVAGADLTRLFGVAAPPPAPTTTAAPPPVQDNRFKLVGVVAQRRAAPSAGLALISLDGQPPKPFGQGAVVDGHNVVLAVRHRQVELGPRGGPVALTLELAALPAAARGNLPGAVGLPAAMPAPPAVAMPSVPVNAHMSPRLVPPPPAVPMPMPEPVPAQMAEPQGDGGVPLQGVVPVRPGGAVTQ